MGNCHGRDLISEVSTIRITRVNFDDPRFKEFNRRATNSVHQINCMQTQSQQPDQSIRNLFTPIVGKIKRIPIVIGIRKATINLMPVAVDSNNECFSYSGQGKRDQRKQLPMRKHMSPVATVNGWSNPLANRMPKAI